MGREEKRGDIGRGRYREEERDREEKIEVENGGRKGVS